MTERADDWASDVADVIRRDAVVAAARETGEYSAPCEGCAGYTPHRHGRCLYCREFEDVALSCEAA